MRRTYSIAFVIGIIVLFIVIIAFEVVALRFAQEQKNQQAQESEAHLKNARITFTRYMTETISNLRRNTMAFAARDQFAEYLNTRQNKAWFEQNVYPGLLTNSIALPIATVEVVDKNRNILVGNNILVPKNEEMLGRSRKELEESFYGRSAAGLLYRSGKLYLVSTAPVTPFYNRANVSGVLSLGIELEGSILSRFKSLSNIEVMLQLPWSKSSTDNFAYPDFNRSVQYAEIGHVQKMGGEVKIPHLLKGLNGEVVAVAWLGLSIPVTNTNENALFLVNAFMPNALFIALATAGICALLIQILVSTPLKEMVKGKRLADSHISEVAEIQSIYLELLSESNLSDVLKGALEENNCGVQIIDSDAKTIQTNSILSDMIGFKKSELASSKNPFFYLDSNAQEVCAEFLEMVCTEDVPLKTEFNAVALNRSGEEKDVRVKLSVHQAPSDTKSFMSIEVVELTQNDSTVDKAKQAKKVQMLGEFASGVAHNINNLLTGIIGSLSMLNRNKIIENEEQRKKLLETIRTAAEECASLARELLQLARLKEGRQVRQPVNINEVVQDVVEMVSSMDGVSSYDFKLSLPEEPVVALCEARGLHQVVLNLLVNAVDSMAKPGLINTVVRVERTSKHDIAIIKVEDQGLGIPEEVKDKIFSPFYTTKKGLQSKTKLGGSGLGLSSALALVESWGGSISCQSESGRGSVFRVKLSALALDQDRQTLKSEEIQPVQ